MREINIKSKHGIFIVHVDDSDFELVNQYKWQILRKPHSLYARTHDKLDHSKTILMHRLLIGVNGKVVDHVDGNGLNNCRNNIRVATISQNAKNYKTPKTNTSGFKGVSKRHNKFRAYIIKDKKQINLGSYIDSIEAAKAYNQAAIKYHGEFARLNQL